MENPADGPGGAVGGRQDSRDLTAPQDPPDSDTWQPLSSVLERVLAQIAAAMAESDR
jgi:hypothetical protein